MKGSGHFDRLVMRDVLLFSAKLCVHRISTNEEGCTRGAARDDGFSARRFGLSGTTPLNEAVSRWADCLRAMGIQWRCRVPLGVGRKVSRGSGSVPLT